MVGTRISDLILKQNVIGTDLRNALRGEATITTGVDVDALLGSDADKFPYPSLHPPMILLADSHPPPSSRHRMIMSVEQH